MRVSLRYHESAGSSGQGNPRFESSINATRDGINNTNWTSNGHGDLKCEVNNRSNPSTVDTKPTVEPRIPSHLG